MKIEDFRHLASKGAVLNAEHKRIEIPIENGGSVVGYFPLESIQVYAYDIRGGELPDLTQLGLRHPEKGRFLRTNLCRSGSCKFVKNGRSAVLTANEVCMDYGFDNVPMTLISHQYVGVEIIMQVDEVIHDSSMYMMLRQSIKSMDLPEFKVREDYMFYFSMSASTRQQLESLAEYCLADSDAAIVMIKTAEIGYNLGSDLKNGQSSQRSFVTKSQLTVAEDIHYCLTEKYGEKWVAAYFAEKYGLSTTTVKNYFKNVFGYDYKEYQIKVRMEKAAQLLRETTLSVGNISLQVGYSTHAKFGAIFKRTFGVTPLEYRRASKIERIQKQTTHPD